MAEYHKIRWKTTGFAGSVWRDIVSRAFLHKQISSAVCLVRLKQAMSSASPNGKRWVVVQLWWSVAGDWQVGTEPRVSLEAIRERATKLDSKRSHHSTHPSAPRGPQQAVFQLHQQLSSHFSKHWSNLKQSVLHFINSLRPETFEKILWILIVRFIFQINYCHGAAVWSVSVYVHVKNMFLFCSNVGLESEPGKRDYYMNKKVQEEGQNPPEP